MYYIPHLSEYVSMNILELTSLIIGLPPFQGKSLSISLPSECEQLLQRTHSRKVE